MSTKKMIYPAHIRINNIDDQEIQTVEDHCRATAEIASNSIKSVGLQYCAYLAGLTHDMGKFTQAFANYISESSNGKPVKKGSVIHSFQAVEFLISKYHSIDAFAAELLATATGAHHGQFDCIDIDGKSGFDHRINAEKTYYTEALENFQKYCASEKELDELFEFASKEIEKIIDTICRITESITNNECCYIERLFYSGLLVRLILSAVIEGDRRDTAAFILRTQSELQEKVANTELWKNTLETVEYKIFKLPHNTPIEIARREISDICRNAANMPGGILRLNAPTGGGKTLSSLRFALAHAARYGKKRIIFTSPLLSILEQNAKEVRNYIQNDEIILEHHSNVIKQEMGNGKELDNRELLIQSWNAPIIITTLVQFLDTLFSGKTSCIRRFHSLCDSIIVIDEVQTVPTKMLSMFSLAVNFLAEICGATVVLCSATQPCLEHTNYPYYETPRDILPYKKDLWKVFERTEIKNAGSMSLEDIPFFAEQILENVDSLLIICNKKAEAKSIFRNINKENRKVFFLSASLCTEHRQNVIQKLKETLDKEKTVCVSTQVVEAGIDISFDCVIRLTAGMDNIIQAAGRCNRHQKFKNPVPVYITELKGENLSMLKEIQKGKEATSILLTEYIKAPEKFSYALDSDISIEFYYKMMYKAMENGHRDYPVKIDGKFCTLLSLLSINTEAGSAGENWILRQAFKTAGDAFSVFDSDTTDVICSYGKGTEIVAALMSERAGKDYVYAKALIEKAKPYTISLYAHELLRLEKENAIFKSAVGAYILLEHYDRETGFDIDAGTLQFMEV